MMSATTCDAVVVSLALRRRPERDDDLPEDVQLDRGDLVVARELELRVQETRLPEVVGARVEGGADPDADELAASLRVRTPRVDPLTLAVTLR